MRTKNMNKKNVIKNINGLSLGDRAYCGPYGTITCTRKACMIVQKNGTTKRGYNSRRFKVTNSTKIANGGNYTMRALRKAIGA